MGGALFPIGILCRTETIHNNTASYNHKNKRKEKKHLSTKGIWKYLGRDEAFSRIRCMKRPLWKLLPATSEWNFSRGYAILVLFPSLKRAYPRIRWASISSTQSAVKAYTFVSQEMSNYGLHTRRWNSVLWLWCTGRYQTLLLHVITRFKIFVLIKRRKKKLFKLFM